MAVCGGATDLSPKRDLLQLLQSSLFSTPSLSLSVWRRSSSTTTASPRHLAIAQCLAARSVGGGGEARTGWWRYSPEDEGINNGEQCYAAQWRVRRGGLGCDRPFGEWIKLLHFSITSSDEF
jgi:hypothetical protein